MVRIAIDIGGGHISLARVDEDEPGLAIHRIDMVRIPASERWNWIEEQIFEFSPPSIDGVFISYPGPVAADGTLGPAPTVTNSGTGQGLVRRLSERLKTKVGVQNDLACAALHFGTTLKSKRCVVVSVSSGIGSKAYVDGGVVCDSLIAGEIGHLPVDFSSQVPCDCGEMNHLQAIASGRGFERVARIRSGIPDLGVPSNEISNESSIFPSARGGEAWAMRLLIDCTKPLVKMLLPVVCCLDLTDLVFVGGVIVHGGDVYEKAFWSAFEEIGCPEFVKDRMQKVVLFERSTNESCLLGAVAYARQFT